VTLIRVCLVGDFSSNPDEGMRRFAVGLRDALATRAEISLVSPMSALADIKSVSACRPQIVHYLPGPSPASLMILKRIKLHLRLCATIATITHPHFVNAKLIWRMLGPDCVVTFSPTWRKYLSGLVTRARLIPGAIDLQRFTPVSELRKAELKNELRLPQESFIALHVGHLRRGRGLSVLSEFPEHGIVPLIVASQSTGQDRGLKSRLQASGCLIQDRYVPDIEKYYQASDCYVFPTTADWRSMDLPQSILEAMACNLPVVTTDFGCVRSLFGDAEGVFVVSRDRLMEAVSKVTEMRGVRRTREAVSGNDWPQFADSILQIYGETLGTI